MTNKERYEKAFGVLHTSEDFTDQLMDRINNIGKEDNNMKTAENKRVSKASKKIVACLVAAFVVVAGASAAYAANIGGIQRTIQIWRYGEQTDAVLTIDPDSKTSHYVIETQDENGDPHTIEGGGIEVDMFGNEHPVSEEDIMEQLDSPDMIVGDDGTATVYWRDQKIDITDKFDENGVCYVTVTDGKKTFYITAHNDGSYSMSNEKYLIEE